MGRHPARYFVSAGWTGPQHARCVVAGDEVFSDANEYTEIEDGFFLEAEGKVRTLALVILLLVVCFQRSLYLNASAISQHRCDSVLVPCQPILRAGVSRSGSAKFSMLHNVRAVGRGG